MTEWPLEDERILLADACVPGRNQHSLWNFVRFAAGWHYRCQAREAAGKGRYWLTEDVHKPFIDWLQLQVDEWIEAQRQGIQRRFQIMAWVFRKFGKTNLVTTCLAPYIMLTDPDLASCIGSETDEKAIEFLSAIKPMLDGSDPNCLFTWFYGNWYNPDRTWKLNAVVTAHRQSPAIKEPSIKTFSVESGITGKHFPFGISDDPISEEKINEAGGGIIADGIRSMDAIYPAFNNDSLLILIGTRYREYDVIGHALDTEGVESWDGHPPPHAIQMGGKWRVYFLQARDLSDTKEYPKGRPVCPRTWSDAAMEDYEQRSPSQYRAQLMGNVKSEEFGGLTRDRIETMKIDRRDVPPVEYATVHLDTAFKIDKRKSKGDRSVIAVWLHDRAPTGMVTFDGAYASAQWESEDFDRALIRVLNGLRSRNIRCRAITDEMEVGGKRGVYLKHLQNVISEAGLKIPEILQFTRAGTNKIVRIREAADYWMDGCVSLVRDAEGLALLIEEMIHMDGQHDDVADAAADVWRPEIWRGRHRNYDEAPYIPRQPGDDVLKGRREQELQDIEYELRTGRRRDVYDEDPEPEPQVHEAIRPW